MEEIYTALEIAEQLKVKKTTVYELIKRGELDATKVGKQLRISQTQLNKYLGTEPSPQEIVPDKVQNAHDAIDSGSSILQMDYLSHTNGLIISGQSSSIVELLRSMSEQYPGSYPMLHSYMNGYNSLYALYYGKTHLALIDICSAKSCDRNFPFVRSLLPGTPLRLVHLCDFQEGFYLPAGNPKGITSITDLSRNDITIINREKGNSSRILLDRLLARVHLLPSQIQGYQHETVSHLAVANAIAEGNADVGIGDLAQIDTFHELEFLPLRTSSLDLVFSAEYQQHPAFQNVLDVISSSAFKNALQRFNGYNTHYTGKLYYL